MDIKNKLFYKKDKQTSEKRIANGGSCTNLWCASTSYLLRYDSCFLLKDNGEGGKYL